MRRLHTHRHRATQSPTPTVVFHQHSILSELLPHCISPNLPNTSARTTSHFPHHFPTTTFPRHSQPGSGQPWRRRAHGDATGTRGPSPGPGPWHGCVDEERRERRRIWCCGSVTVCVIVCVQLPSCTVVLFILGKAFVLILYLSPPFFPRLPPSYLQGLV